MESRKTKAFKIIKLVCIVLVIYALGFSTHFLITVQNQPINADIIYRLTNDERMKAGLQPLLRHPELDRTAQARADDMVRRNYYSHYDPVTGENMANILNGVEACSDASENISSSHEVPFDNNADTIKGWMASPPHREAILDPSYTYIGVGVNDGIAVQHFCTATSPT